MVVRHFLSEHDVSRKEYLELLELTRKIKPVRFSKELEGKTLIMLFEKPSTRTRLSFEIGTTQLGGHAVFVDASTSQISRGESMRDTAEVMSRYADIIMGRVFKHSTLTEMSNYATIPIINGLSDLYHPCQGLADLFTIMEHKKKLKGLKVCFVGDCDNNVTHSLMLASAICGCDFYAASPTGFEPKKEIVDAALKIARETGSKIVVTHDPIEAVKDADVVYTDTWFSMGKEGDREERRKIFAPYQVNLQLVSHAKPDYIFMHCLPAHIGEEVTAEVAYSKNSVIFDEAENRMHAQKALMLFLIGKTPRKKKDGDSVKKKNKAKRK